MRNTLDEDLWQAKECQRLRCTWVSVLCVSLVLVLVEVRSEWYKKWLMSFSQCSCQLRWMNKAGSAELVLRRQVRVRF